MTDTTQQPTEATEARKAELIAEGAKRGLKFDKRFAVNRMEDLIAEHDAKGVSAARPEPEVAAPPAPALAASTPPPEAEEPDAAALKVQNEELHRRLAELEAKAAAIDKEPITRNMTTSMKLSLPGDTARYEAERKLLTDRCAQVGIAHLIPPRANNDSIRDLLGRHMAEKAQKAAAEEATARLKAKGPQEQFVSMRVLPLGDRKISRGIHIPGFGDEMFERGDIIENVPLATAKEHEANGMGEIIGA